MNEPVSQTIVERQAKNDFEKALAKGFWRSFWSWFTQSDNKLMPFDEVRKALPANNQHDIGMREIFVDKIVGSVGRYQDFDRAFLPRHQFMRSRWVSIDRAHYQDVILPPIEAYKIGDVYFVKDGNHRVSVARQRGQAYIDAYITEISSPVEITPDTNIDELIRKVEQAQFFERTGLDKLPLEQKIELTLPGGYVKLLEHIDVHRWFMGEQRKGPVLYEEAVTDWYASVYLPLIRVIDCQKVIKEFPGRTEADLYLWIIEHLWYLREEINADVSLEMAAAHYAEKYASHGGPFRWLMDLVDWTTRQIKGPDFPNPSIPGKEVDQKSPCEDPDCIDS
jgi:hypothetical protein